MFRTDWLTSNGGPLLLVGKSTLPYWGGISNIGGASSSVDEAWQKKLPSDYERACAVTSWLSVIDVVDRKAIVLGGDPLPTALWDFDGVIALVRWIVAPNDKSVYDAMKRFNKEKLISVEKIEENIEEEVNNIIDSSVGGHWRSLALAEFKIEVSAHLPRLTACRLPGRKIVDVTTTATMALS